MLDIYVEVGQVIHKAILSTMKGAPPSSSLGKFQRWTSSQSAY